MIESRFAPAALLVSIVLFSSARAGAQDSGTAGDVTACCMIVAIDANTGIVTVKVNATGNVFQFKPNGFSPIDGLRSSPALAGLKPGQAVYANFTNHQVSLDGRTVCCTMTSGPHAATAAAIRPVHLPAIAPGAPCCGIVAVDAETGIVTAKVNANGNVFQFKPNGYSPIDGLRSSPALASLKPGQAVYANFTNHQVSLDGFAPCCGITSGPQAATAAAIRPVHLPAIAPSVPCCGIVAVDAEAGIVTVKVNATGNIFQFKPSNTATLASLKPGQAVYANFTAHQVSLDGRTLWAGQQLAASVVAPKFSPVDRAKYSPIDGARYSPVDAARPSEPCCAIVAVDAEAGIVTVKVNATGNVFQFKPNGYSPIDGLRSNPALASLKPGQAVYANFTNHQLSLDGRTVWAGQQLLH